MSFVDEVRKAQQDAIAKQAKKNVDENNVKKIYETMKTVILDKIKEHNYNSEVKLNMVQFIFESCVFYDHSNLTITIENKDKNGKVKNTKYKVTAMELNKLTTMFNNEGFDTQRSSYCAGKDGKPGIFAFDALTIKW